MYQSQEHNVEPVIKILPMFFNELGQCVQEHAEYLHGGMGGGEWGGGEGYVCYCY